MRRKRVNPYPIILQMLTRDWHAPHEVNLELRLSGCHVAAEATTARIRDLRKVRYGDHAVIKRLRAGESYYEYRVLPAERQKAA